LPAKRVVFVVAPEGFNDYELFHPKRILESEGIEVIVASTVLGRCRGMRGAEAESAKTIEEIEPSEYDGIVAVGGHGALRYLSDNRSLIDLFTKFNEQGKLVSAIGRARHALHNAGLFGSNFSWGPEVEINGNVIAARPPATTPGWNSKRFGDLLVKHLRGS
jgi:putative intracellular protease/amidase